MCIRERPDIPGFFRSYMPSLFTYNHLNHMDSLMEQLRFLWRSCMLRGRVGRLMLLAMLIMVSVLPSPTLAYYGPLRHVPVAPGTTPEITDYTFKWLFMPARVPNVIIRDCPGDVGVEPNTGCWAFYASPSIYVRNSPGAFPDVHQSPIPGQPNYVYAKVENIGTGMLRRGRVHFYVAKASTGLHWSSQWVNNYIGGVLYGDEIGFANVANLPPGGSVNVGVLWNNVPDPYNYSDPDARHFCLLARFVSDEDPMSFTEVTSINANVQNNNNIAWKNICVLDCATPRVAVDVANPTENPMNVRLRFAIPPEEMEDPIINHCTLTVDLGPRLYQMWVQNERQGEGIQDLGNGRIRITGVNAWIGGLELDPDERRTIHPEVVFYEEEAPDRVYHWAIEQYDDDEDELIGGEMCDIRPRCRADVMIRDCNADGGAEPSLACGPVFWTSPAIYIRNNPGALPAVHQNPIGGLTNWAYVQVKNIGERILHHGTVELYYSKASLGLVWPANWNPGGYPYHDRIGIATVTNLGPNQSTTLEIRWDNVPNPAAFSDPDARHFCLLARFVSTEDPMTYPEGPSIAFNVPYNNNIAQKNISIMDCDYPRAAVDVYNGTNNAAVTQLRFDVPEADEDDNALNHVAIAVDLGGELATRWRAQGAQGEGIEAAGNTGIRITSPHAWIGGFELEAEEKLTIHVEIQHDQGDEPEDARDTYEWTVTQYAEDADGTPVLVGGETYDIRRKCRPDVMIGDYTGDVGAEPNLSLGGHYWSSPEIWVRNAPDGIPIHQFPIGATTNWIYVRLKNIGNAPLTSGALQLYFAKASTGLTWPSDWVSGTPLGDKVTPLPVPVPVIMPGATVVMQVQWDNVPDPTVFSDPDARHFCLLARFESTQDPISFTEIHTTDFNVPYNNNIAMKNTAIMDCDYPRAAIDVKNVNEKATQTELRFDTPQEDGDDNALNHCNIMVDLGNELMGLWKQGGARGIGVEYDGEGTALAITSPHAWIGGLKLEADTRYTMHVQVKYNQGQEPENAKDAYEWNITQYEKGRLAPVGGENVVIRRKCRPDVMIRDYVGDVGAEPNLSLGGHFWSSPDIYVRNSNDGLLAGNDVHQNPIGGTANWVYVKLKNIGNATLTGGTLKVYFSKASTGLWWSANWTGPYPFSSMINAVPVPGLAPGASTIIEVPWLATPDPGWFSDPDARHFCLLARFESAQDPMSYPEVPSIALNVPRNNNIAQKNTTLMDCEFNRATVNVRNGTNGTRVTDIRFDTPYEGANTDNALNHFVIRVELDEETAGLWEEGGEQGDGIVRDKNNPNTLLITSPHAWIGGLELEAGAGFDMKVHIENINKGVLGESGSLNDGTTQPGTVVPVAYPWVITQYERGNPAPVGGEDYELYIKRCRPNILIRDCLSDIGAEPCTVCPVNWESPDIYIRNQPDGLANNTHQEPVIGADNHVYVKLKNIGNGTLASGRVYVYYSKAGTGFDWNADWVGAAPLGDVIGYADVSGLVSGAETTVEIQWTLPVLLDWQRHFCLLARFESVEDPMTFSEVTASGVNVYNNNNIAQKNIDILNGYNRVAEVVIRSDNPDGAEGELHFDVPQQEEQGILEHGPVTVVLGGKLYTQWADAGYQGEGIEELEELQAVSITAPHAWIGGLQLNHEGTTAYIIMPDQRGDNNVYHWTLSQYENGEPRPAGGVTYEMNSSPGRTVIGCDDRTANYLSLILQPTTRTLQFTIPQDEGQGILAHGPIRVELGPDLYQKWASGGYQGQGITDEGNGKSILITHPNAWIGGLNFQELAIVVLRITMPPCDGSGRIYHWSIAQYDGLSAHPVGRMDYEILMGDGATKPAMPEKGDLSRTLELSARPNPFNTETSIGFTLPLDARVTLAIYDANGGLVRTLLASTEKRTGRHEIGWDGAAADGTPVANGTYFYRLVTPMGTTEQQLKLVR